MKYISYVVCAWYQTCLRGHKREKGSTSAKSASRLASCGHTSHDAAIRNPTPKTLRGTCLPSCLPDHVSLGGQTALVPILQQPHTARRLCRISPFTNISDSEMTRYKSPCCCHKNLRNNVRRGKALSSGGCEPRPIAVAPVGSSQGGLRRQRCRLKHSGDEGPRMAAQQPCGPEREVNAEQASKRITQKPTLRCLGEGRWQIGKRATYAPICICRGIGASTHGR